jgi:hypothetical protein
MYNSRANRDKNEELVTDFLLYIDTDLVARLRFEVSDIYIWTLNLSQTPFKSLKKNSQIYNFRAGGI